MLRFGRVAASVALSLTVILVPAVGARAEVPANDRLRRAIAVDQLPFLARQDTTEATANGPRFCGNNSSVFYRFTPERDVAVQADTFGSRYDTVLTVFTGSRGAFEPVACNDDAAALQSAVRFDARAGTTYYLMVSGCCGSGQDNVGGRLTLGVTSVPMSKPNATVEIQRRATLHAGGLVRLTASITCNQRMVVQVVGTLRQLRADNFVARGSFDDDEVTACPSGRTVVLRAWIDTETGAAFEEGPAALIKSATFATNGFESTFVDIGRTRVRITRA
jgi:hypothetical protein